MYGRSCWDHSLTTATASQSRSRGMCSVTKGHFSCRSSTAFKASAVQSATIQPQSRVLKEKPPCRAQAVTPGWGCPHPSSQTHPTATCIPPQSTRSGQGPIHQRCVYSQGPKLGTSRQTSSFQHRDPQGCSPHPQHLQISQRIGWGPGAPHPIVNRQQQLCPCLTSQPAPVVTAHPGSEVCFFPLLPRTP